MRLNKPMHRLKILLLILPFICVQSKCSGTKDLTAQTNDSLPLADSIVTFTISSVGDLMCHSTQFNFAKVAEDSFNFEPCFEYILPWLQKPDLLLGNLETTLAGNKQAYSGFPYFNTPDDYAIALKNIGFDFLITANNHSNDTGEKGILRTIKQLNAFGFNTTGTYTSQNDRDSIRIVDVKGVKIAIMAYSYSTNGLPLATGKPWLVNMCDSVLIKRDIETSRSLGAELVVVFYHFGEEYQRLPSKYQENFVNFAVDCGADVVFGSHTHVLQPATFIKGVNSTVDSVFVAYSMGNFISNQQDEYTDEGVIFNLHFEKNLHSNKIVLTKADYVPTWVYKGKHEAKKLHVVFPAFDPNDPKLPEFVQQFYKDEIQKAITNTTKTMNTYTSSIKPATIE